MKRCQLSTGLFLLFALLFTAATAFAQKGVVSGVISDEASGETLIGATVIIAGTATGTATDFDGKYSLDLEPGIYNLEYSYIGYPEKTIEGIVVTAKTVTYQDVTLSDTEGIALDIGVTVSAERLTNTEVAVLVERKESVVISDNLSIQEMSRYGASDAGGAL
ncbi:MAG: carboxypeptidase-like regulatory domain-containing protein, partial [Saprospiraceae bacterium]